MKAIITVPVILLFAAAALFAQSKATLNLAGNNLSATGMEIAASSTYADSVKQAKDAIKKNEQSTRRIALGIGAIVAVGTGLYFNSLTSDAYDKYQSETSVDPSIHAKNWKKYKEKVRIRNAFYITGSILAAGFAISIPF